MEQDSDLLCGWGSLKPKAIQVFNTPRWVLFFLSVASFLQGLIINGLINTVVTSIERRFDLSSSQTGLIVSSYDIAACVCLAFASYFGGNGHKPRWLGWGIMIMGLGSLVFALPHFTTPAYQVSSVEVSDLCSGANSSLCEGKGRGGLSRYSLVFMLSQFLHGIGATPLYTLGVTYLDQNVHCSAAPVYIGQSVTKTHSTYLNITVTGPILHYALISVLMFPHHTQTWSCVFFIHTCLTHKPCIFRLSSSLKQKTLFHLVMSSSGNTASAVLKLCFKLLH
uniref:Major facilitator superfamily (MFS) profile domain-containing protein n=1 Tax=Periophthalmus magnuspinnatus TaxID=409849 RepID=A0A3B3ZVN5_9GOBI